MLAATEGSGPNRRQRTGGLAADSGQGAARLTGEDALGASDIGRAVEAGEIDGEVAQTSHHGRPVSDADARAILIEGDLMHIMGAVLDPPLAAVEAQQCERVGLLGRQAGDGEEGFAPLLAGLQLGDLALDAADLCDIGEVDIVLEGRAGEQSAVLETDVALFEGLGVQGGNALGSVY